MDIHQVLKPVKSHLTPEMYAVLQHVVLAAFEHNRDDVLRAAAVETERKRCAAIPNTIAQENPNLGIEALGVLIKVRDRMEWKTIEDGPRPQAAEPVGTASVALEAPAVE